MNKKLPKSAMPLRSTILTDGYGVLEYTVNKQYFFMPVEKYKDKLHPVFLGTNIRQAKAKYLEECLTFDSQISKKLKQSLDTSVPRDNHLIFSDELVKADYLTSQLPDINITLLSSQDADEEAWLQQRQMGIGGSDVGAICGISKWSSAREIYLKKTNQYEENISERQAEIFKFGHRMESVIAELYSEATGTRLFDAGMSFRSNETPWLLGNCDRFIIDDNDDIVGILECKTASEYFRNNWLNGDVPEYYIAQVQHYLHVTNLEYAVICAVVGGNTLVYYTIMRNRNWYDKELLPKLDKFWNYHVANLVQPPIDGSDASTDILKEQYKGCDKEKFDLPEELSECLIQLDEIKGSIKQLDMTKKLLENKIKDGLGDKEFGMSVIGSVSWKPVVTKRIDTKRLKNEEPELYEKYAKESTSRRFTYAMFTDDDDDE